MRARPGRIKWDLGRFGKLHVRHGKGARGSGPRERMVPLINGADRTLRWFIEDVWGQFDDDHTRPGAPLFPSERKNTDGSARRVGDDALRNGLENAVETHLPSWTDKLTPHVLRHFCASQLVGCLRRPDWPERWRWRGMAHACEPLSPAPPRSTKTLPVRRGQCDSVVTATHFRRSRQSRGPVTGRYAVAHGHAPCLRLSGRGKRVSAFVLVAR
jgi:hypothetical protein